MIFADENFEYAKRSDSVYEIKSYFETTSNFKKVKTNYDIVLKYNGGTSLNERNWKVVNLTKNKKSRSEINRPASITLKQSPLN